METGRRGRANPYHECECVELIAASPQSRRELHRVLKRLGYRPVDDFYTVDRRDRIYPWQSTSLFTVEVYLGDTLSYETGEDVHEGVSTHWDRLEVRYLMASTPASLIDAFVDALEALVQALDLELRFAGERRDPAQLRAQLGAIAGWLDEQYFEAGSQNLALLVADEYPAR